MAKIIYTEINIDNLIDDLQKLKEKGETKILWNMIVATN